MSNQPKPKGCNQDTFIAGLHLRERGMERAVARCGVCKINQYVPTNGCCRRCAAPLDQITKPEAGISISELFASHKTDVLNSSLVSERNPRSRWATALALVLLNERRQRKLSQREVAQRAGLPRTYISRIENGRLGISFATLTLCAKAFGLSVAAIVARAEAMITSNTPDLPTSVSTSVSRTPTVLDRQALRALTR
jgi:DNA-binding XRE family transcriptional regulator